MAGETSAEAIAEAIRHFFDGSPEAFITNIREIKRTQTWPAFAQKILDFYTQQSAQ